MSRKAVALKDSVLYQNIMKIHDDNIPCCLNCINFKVIDNPYPYDIDNTDMSSFGDMPIRCKKRDDKSKIGRKTTIYNHTRNGWNDTTKIRKCFVPTEETEVANAIVEWHRNKYGDD